MDFRKGSTAINIMAALLVEGLLVWAGFKVTLLIVVAFFGLTSGLNLFRFVRAGQLKALYEQTNAKQYKVKFALCFSAGLLCTIMNNILLVMMDVMRMAGGWVLLKMAFDLFNGTAGMAFIA